MFRIPLSYTPIDYEVLTKLFQQYEGKDHTQIIEDFEHTIADSLGVKHAICLQSGTAALHVALQLAGIGVGDHVIVPSFTYIGSVSPVLYQRAIPVFVDCDPIHWNMDLNLVEEAYNDLSRKGKKLKAIIAVHNYGNPCDVDQLRKMADRWGIQLIEDAAEALGSTWQGKQVGNTGLGVISFNNNKINTTFGGSVLLISNDAFHAKAKFLSSHARENLPYYEHRVLGYNYRMGSLNAAYGLSNWSKVNSHVQHRLEIFRNYQGELGQLAVSFPIEEGGATSNRWLSTFVFEAGLVVDIEKRLKEAFIETRPLWNPLHGQPLFEGFPNYDRGIGLTLFKTGICLPSSTGLAGKEQSEITEIILRK